MVGLLKPKRVEARGDADRDMEESGEATEVNQVKIDDAPASEKLILY